ncbi:MAG: hypothetical protein K1W34_02850 [Lachnospiraceae bacterium]
MRQLTKRGFALLLAGMLTLLSNVPALAEENTLENPDVTGNPDSATVTVQSEEPQKEATPVVQANDSIVAIPDAELKNRLLAGGFDKNGDGELSTSEMQSITQLDVRTSIYTKDVTNLSGLESATNVETFAINCAQITDFSVLRSMPNINTVAINNATINVSALADSLKSSTKLETLILNSGVVTDISALGSLSQIKTLNLYTNSISDISGIANLTNLQELILDATGVSNLSPLASCKNLRKLSIQYTAVTDLAPLASCANLEILYLGYDLNKTSGITDVSALASCKNLKELSITGDTAITAEMIFDNLTPNEQTRTLSIGSNDIALFNNCKISLRVNDNWEENFGAKNVTWKTDKPDIVEVTDDFKFNAKQAGQAKVTATFGSTNKIFNITVKSSEQPTPTPTPTPAPEPDKPVTNPSAEFGSAPAGLTVSATDAQTISRSALAFVQKNCSEQLAKLGDDYKVIANLNLTAQKADDVEEKAKNAFDGVLGSMDAGQYYNIGITASVTKDGKVVEELQNILIPNLDKEITLNLKIPESLRKDGRSYTMLHYHGDKAAKLDTKVSNYTASFRTSAFSPYLLAYKDAKGTASSNTTTSSPRTGDTANIILWVALLAMALLVIVPAKKRRTF